MDCTNIKTVKWADISDSEDSDSDVDKKEECVTQLSDWWLFSDRHTSTRVFRFIKVYTVNCSTSVNNVLTFARLLKESCKTYKYQVLHAFNPKENRIFDMIQIQFIYPDVQYFKTLKYNSTIPRVEKSKFPELFWNSHNINNSRTSYNKNKQSLASSSVTSDTLFSTNSYNLLNHTSFDEE